MPLRSFSETVAQSVRRRVRRHLIKRNILADIRHNAKKRAEELLKDAGVPSGNYVLRKSIEDMLYT